MRVLALDYGSARTGVAVTDATGEIASPLTVVERAASVDGLARIANLVREHGVERVVVGLPLTLRGERGQQALETDAFVESLERQREAKSEMDDPDAEDESAAAEPERSRASLASVEDFRKRIAAQRSRSARAALAIDGHGVEEGLLGALK